MAKIKNRSEFMDRSGRFVNEPNVSYKIKNYLKVQHDLVFELIRAINEICKTNNGVMKIGLATDRDYADTVFIANAYSADEVVKSVLVNGRGGLDVETDRETHSITELDCEELLHLYNTMVVCNDHPEYMEA